MVTEQEIEQNIRDILNKNLGDLILEKSLNIRFNVVIEEILEYLADYIEY